MEHQHERRRTKFLDQDFKPNHNHIVESREVVLRTLAAQRLLYLCFFRNQISLYQVQVIIPNLAAQDRWQKLEETVIAMLDKLGDEAKAERDRTKMLAEQSQIPLEGPGVFGQTEPLNTLLQVYSPEANRFLDLLLLIDNMFDIANRLWIRGRFSTQQQRSLATHWRRKLVRFTRELHLTRIRAARTAKGERAEKMKARDDAAAARSVPIASSDAPLAETESAALTEGVSSPPEVDNVVRVQDIAPRRAPRRRARAAAAEAATTEMPDSLAAAS